MPNLTVPLFDAVVEDAALHFDFNEVLQTGRFVDGAQRDKFEKDFAGYVQARHVVSLNSGTDALEAALRAHARMIPVERVAVPANTFLGTVSAVRAAGLEPVFIDIDLDDGLLRIEDVREQDACIMVDLCGHQAPRMNLGEWTIVDGCQSFAALTSPGLTTCYSFHPTKPLGGYGTGGAVATMSDEVDRSVHNWRWHGVGGRNSRLAEIQAYVLNMKLPEVGERIARRWEIAGCYHNALSELGMRVTRPSISDWHTYPVIMETETERDAFGSFLIAHGVGTKKAYPPLTDRCPRALQWSQRVLYLPIWAGMTDDQVSYVTEVCAQWHN